jgi:hypothetical protein
MVSGGTVAFPSSQPSSGPRLSIDGTASVQMLSQDHAVMHPSVDDDPGVATLAGSRLGLLGKPYEEQNEHLSFLGLADELMHNVNAHIPVPDAGHLCKGISRNPIFRLLSVLAITANTVYIGASADHQVKQSMNRVRGESQEDLSRAPDICFAAWFALELAIRLLGDGWEFFSEEDVRWNLFDAILVCNSVIELAVPGLSNFSFLRILRVFRLVRIVRIVRAYKALCQLRTMVFALLNSFTCLMWAFALMLLIVFIFGIIFDGGVSTYLDGVDINQASEVAKAEQIADNFGTLYKTMVTLYASIMGGQDWMEYGHQLQSLEYGDAYLLLFIFYIGFCCVGMLNVVTGIFVDSAVCTRTDDEVVDCFKEDQRRTSEEVRRIFQEGDTDKSGTLTLEELISQLENPWVKAYFSGLDIDPSEARIIFTLIDTDGSNAVSIDEFVDGTMKLKGSAKSIDVLSLMYDQARLLSNLTSSAPMLRMKSFVSKSS